MIFRQLFDPATSTYTYLLADEESREAVIIDSVLEQVDRDQRLLEELGLTLRFALETHVHADHVTGAGTLRERLGAETVVSKASGVRCADRSPEHGEQIAFGRYRLEVRSTPGHTAGCVTYVLQDQERTLAFTGDALFVRGCGRTDFQGGSAETLYRSVHDQLFSLPDDAVIYPGHDYKGHRSSTVAEERAHNPRLKLDHDVGAFSAIMGALKLSHPKRMAVAVPANMACGIPELARARGQAVYQDLDASEPIDLSQYRVIDVREPGEWEAEPPPLEGAELVPLGELEAISEGWSREQSLLIYCQRGGRGLRACSLLSAQGFQSLTHLKGGLSAWYETRSADAQGEV